MAQQQTIKTSVELDATQAEQEIAKLNAKASDSTKDLEDRLEAKNKQIEIQNKLSKKTVEALEEEVKKLKEEDAELGKILKAEDKLNKAKIKATKITENNAKAQAKLTEALEDSKDKFKELDDATGGVISSFKTLLSNPIGLFLTAIVGAFSALKSAVARSGKATETFNKIGAKFSGILNGLLAVLEPVVIFIGEKLLAALNDPKQAIIDLGNSIKENLINRVKAIPVIWGAVIKVFKGDFKGAAKQAADGFIQLNTGITDGTEKIKKFGEEAKKNFEKAATATNDLANAERQLVKNRIALEKTQLTSLRLAEEERQKRDDTSKSIEERIEANRRLGEILDEQLQKELALAQQSLNLAIAQKNATGDTIENLEAIGDAELALLEIRERITGQRSEQLTNENALLDEQKQKKEEEVQKALEEEEAAAKKKEEEEEKRLQEFNEQFEQQIEFDEIELERKRLNGEATAELEKEILRNRAEIEIANAKGNADKILNIQKRLKLEEDKIDAASLKAKMKTEEAQLNVVIGAAGEIFGITQELALAQQLIAAPKAIGDIFKTAAARPTIAGRILHVTSGLATVVPPIVKGIAEIKKARFSKSKGGSAGTSVPTPSVSSIAGASSSTPTANISPESIENLDGSGAANLGVDLGISDGATASAANNVSGSSSGEVVFSESRFQDFRNEVEFKEERTTLS